MSIFGHFITAIGCGIASTISQTTRTPMANAKAERNMQRDYHVYPQEGLLDKDSWHSLALELKEKINKLGSYLPPLYEAINWQPGRGPYIRCKGEFIRGKMPAPGIQVMDDLDEVSAHGYGISIELICTSVGFSPVSLRSIDADDGANSVEECLDSVRESYRLPPHGFYTDKEYWDGSQWSNADQLTSMYGNRIVRRTPEEIHYFDYEIRPRILCISNKMINLGQAFGVAVWKHRAEGYSRVGDLDYCSAFDEHVSGRTIL